MSPTIPAQSSLIKPDIARRMLSILRTVFSFAIPAPASRVPPKLARYDARDGKTTTKLLVSIIERDGGVIVENLISSELASQIKSDLAPYFNTDKIDPSGFFPTTTQRATGLLAKSDACVELACNKTYIDVANAMISSTYTYWTGQTQETVTGKPIISSTVGFRVNPGGRQQDLHRDDGYDFLASVRYALTFPQ
jgi:ectoine hydroxylase-related dioxygenase (phytanoyl-CoA dioxygenase family)